MMSLNLLLMVFIVSFISCKNHDEVYVNPDSELNDHYQDLHDTLFQASQFPVNFSEKFYDIDIDRDSVVDVTLKVHTNYSSFAIRENYIQILLKNGYEINYTTLIETTWHWNPTLTDTIFRKDTIMIPKVHHLMDLISIDSDFSDQPIMLTYSYDPGGVGVKYNSFIGRNLWIADDYQYIVFRKIEGDKNKLAWLKVKVKGYQAIHLNSCKYVEKTEETILEQ